MHKLVDLYLFFVNLYQKNSYSRKQKALDRRLAQMRSINNAVDKEDESTKQKFSDRNKRKDILSQKTENNASDFLKNPPNNTSLEDRKKKAEGNFAGKAQKRNSDLVYLVRGKDGDRSAWHYVLVDRVKLPVFLRKTQGGSLDVADYGKVLKSGWGVDPPEEVVQEMKEKYGGD